MTYDKDILDKTGIFVFKNAVDHKLCNITINDFKNNPQEHFDGKTGDGVMKDVKNTIDYRPKDHIAKQYYDILRSSIAEIIEIRKSLEEYVIQLTRPQFQLNKKQEGFFVWHDDSVKKYNQQHRLLASIFYLNDVEEGGETEFKYQEYLVKPETGKLVIFPATWEYLHRGNIPISNDKYIVTNFIFRFY